MTQKVAAHVTFLAASVGRQDTVRGECNGARVKGKLSFCKSQIFDCAKGQVRARKAI